MPRRFFVLLVLLLAVSTHATEPRATQPPATDPALVKETGSCQLTAKPSKTVYFFKQWHLSPSENTSNIDASKALPQYQNQKAIYEQLDAWITKKKISVLLGEGCPAPRVIDSNAPENFNGWPMSELVRASQSPSYSDVLTNVTYKLAAKWKTGLRVRCADNSDAIKKELMAFSDARGIVGYTTRLEQYKDDPEHAQGYLDDVIRLYRMKKSATVSDALVRLQHELKTTVRSVIHWNNERDADLAETIASDPSPVIAVVFGGAHAEGVRKILEKKGIGCVIYEPTGYRDDETQMIEALKELVK